MTSSSAEQWPQSQELNSLLEDSRRLKLFENHFAVFQPVHKKFHDTTNLGVFNEIISSRRSSSTARNNGKVVVEEQFESFIIEKEYDLHNLKEDRRIVSLLKKQLEISLYLALNENPRNEKLPVLLNELNSILKSMDNYGAVHKISVQPYESPSNDHIFMEPQYVLLDSAGEINGGTLVKMDHNESMSNSSSASNLPSTSNKAVFQLEDNLKYSYKKGDFVFAKFSNYEPWPAKVVTKVPGKDLYTVEFYGEHEVADVGLNNLYPLTKQTFKAFSIPPFPTQYFHDSLDEFLQVSEVREILGLEESDLPSPCLNKK